MSRLIRDTDIIRKLNNLIEAIETEPRNARYDKMGLLKIVDAIIGAVEGIDEAYNVEAVVQKLEWLKSYDYDCEENGCVGEFCAKCTLDKAIEIVESAWAPLAPLE